MVFLKFFILMVFAAFIPLAPSTPSRQLRNMAFSKAELGLLGGFCAVIRLILVALIR